MHFCRRSNSGFMEKPDALRPFPSTAEETKYVNIQEIKIWRQEKRFELVFTFSLAKSVFFNLSSLLKLQLFSFRLTLSGTSGTTVTSLLTMWDGSDRGLHAVGQKRPLSLLVIRLTAWDKRTMTPWYCGCGGRNGQGEV